ncbi:MAG: hypothetical protein ABF261_05610 [Candidatus Arcticimaribacter sp.]
MKRRSFIHKVALAGTAPALLPKSSFAHQTNVTSIKNDPIAICTWNFKEANATAGKVLMKGDNALNAVILAAQVKEENPANRPHQGFTYMHYQNNQNKNIAVNAYSTS